MNDRWKAVGRWVLVPIVFVVTSVVVYILGLGLFLYLESFEIRWAAAAHLKFPPSYLLKVSDLLEIFMLAVIWVVPVAWAVGFASRRRAILSVLWGLSISLMLTAVFVWFGREPFSRIFAALGAVVLICALLYLIVRKTNRRVLLLANVVVLVSLFIPRLIVLATVPKLPPQAHKVWSVVLEKGTWQAMNTGRGIVPTRQLTFAGDRIIAAFDAGFAAYEGKKPMSRYRVLSLDRNTGAVRNQMELVRSWADIPYVFGTGTGKIVLVTAGLTRLLNPDLSPAGIELQDKGKIVTISPDGTILGEDTYPGMSLLSAETLEQIFQFSIVPEMVFNSVSRRGILTMGVFGGPTKSEETVAIEGTDHHDYLFHVDCGFEIHFLTEDRVLISGCGKIRIFDSQGKVIKETQSTGTVGKYAGVSQDGSRFALQYSDERGDPSMLLYEQFVIYGATTLKPIASISVDDLPDWQSWSAFSPDGRFFAVGNPDKLTLYQIP